MTRADWVVWPNEIRQASHPTESPAAGGGGRLQRYRARREVPGKRGMCCAALETPQRAGDFPMPQTGSGFRRVPAECPLTPSGCRGDPHRCGLPDTGHEAPRAPAGRAACHGHRQRPELGGAERSVHRPAQAAHAATRRGASAEMVRGLRARFPGPPRCRACSHPCDAGHAPSLITQHR